MTKAMQRALRDASLRERGTICPIRGVHGFAEKALLQAMLARGFAEFTDERGPYVPLISQAGRNAATNGEPT